MQTDRQVALVQLPFAMASWPSLGLSLLKSGLKTIGVSSRIHYLNLAFAELIGEELYEKIALGAPANTDLLGEWVFCEALYGVNNGRDNEYLSSIFPADAVSSKSKGGTPMLSRADAFTARDHVEVFLESCLSTLNCGPEDIIGFTSVFQQHIPSLALAKRIKERFPNSTIIFGGANCEDDMGQVTLDNFSFVDAVCSGEADIVFPKWVKARLDGKRSQINGITEQRTAGEFSIVQSGRVTSTAPVEEMDSLPYPDYDDYFDDPLVRGKDSSRKRIIFETSRGCWWGQKHHCTFCGLNGLGMSFRFKSSARAFAEVNALVDLYGKHTRRFSAADNIIPMDYFNSFLPEIEKSSLKLDLFYETKANLTESQIAQYKRSGLSEIQPGIESLNDQVLKLMRKGVSALQNIQLLKLCAKYDIRPYWNYLFGFPNEDPSSYTEQPQLLKKLVHFSPPVGCASVRFDRFSPFHTNPGQFGLSNLTPYPAYSVIYPNLSAQDRSRIAYYFTGEYLGSELVQDYTRDLSKVVNDWRDNASKSALFHCGSGHSSVVFDCRHSDQVEIMLLTGITHHVFDLCESITTELIVCSQLEKSWSFNAIRNSIEILVSYGLVLRENGRLLAISVPTGSGHRISDGARKKLSSHLDQEIDAMDDASSLRIPSGKFTHLCVAN